MKNLKLIVRDYLHKSNRYHNKLDDYSEKIIEICMILKGSKHIFLCGNGGSSAIASHFTNDLIKICRLNAHCLSDNTPVLTAYANDINYSNIFSEQLGILSEPGDTLVIFSGSGTSKNIVLAVDYALNHQMNIIAFVGISGGLVYSEHYNKQPTLHFIHINSDMLHSEDWFSTISHVIPIVIMEMQNEN